MTDETPLYIAHLALAGIALILIWAAVKIWREAPPEFHATVAELHWGRVLPALGWFSVGFVLVAFGLTILPR